MKVIKVLSVISVFVMIFYSPKLFGQEAFVSFNAGYSTRISSQNIDFLDFYNRTYNENSTKYEQVNVSLGKGLSFEGTFGYMFNENIGTELGVSYLLGSSTEAKRIENYTDYISTQSIINISSNMLRINPSVLLKTKGNVLNPYAKLGIVIGVGKILFGSASTGKYIDSEVELNQEMNLELDGGFAFGISSAIGADFTSYDNMSFFAEINTINMSYAPTKGEVTKFNENGENQLTSLTVSEKEVEFVDSYTRNYNNDEIDSEPSKELKQKFPFSSIGLNIGLRIKL